MKSIIIALASLTFSTTILTAQTKKDTEVATIHVDGVCGSCKKRIENAAYIPGVKNAEWDKASGNLTIHYKPSKVTKEEIAKAVAEKGHNADEQKANPKAYNNLPKCCAYNSGIQKH